MVILDLDQKVERCQSPAQEAEATFRYPSAQKMMPYLRFEPNP